MRKLIIAWMITVGVIMGVHTWQDSLSQDMTWVWSCHTMGNRLCGPQEPWIQFAPGNLWGGGVQ